MRYLLKFIMNTRLYSWFMRDVIWRFRFSNYYSKFPGWKYIYMYSLLRPGDVIVSSDKYKLTSFLIKGQWDHAAYFLGKSPGEKYEVAEMVHTGYRKSMFFDICKEAETVAIYRCESFDETYVAEMNKICKTFESYLYDIYFNFELTDVIKSLYCSELIYKLDYEKRMQVSLEDLAGLGQQYISPDGLTKGLTMKLVAHSENLFCQFQSKD